MGLEQFVICDNNPNEDSGGGGCACHPQGNQDCTGPFVVFTSVSTDDPYSPAIVIGHECFAAAQRKLKKGERQPSRHVVNGTAVEVDV